MLDSLIIKNFRSLAHFEVSKLGRVNLIVGKNNSGKSTVLEALRIYAGNAQRQLLESIAQVHDERFYIRDGEQFDVDSVVPFQDFFTGRSFSLDGSNNTIEIGAVSSPASRLTIQYALLEEWDEEVDLDLGEEKGSVTRKHRILSKGDMIDAERESQQVFVIKTGERTFSIMKLLDNRTRGRFLYDSKAKHPCSHIPTQFISMDELADEWDAIALTGQDMVVKDALRIIAPEFENLVFVRAEGISNPAWGQPRRRLDRTAMVKLSGLDRPVPLNSLGDGMLRVLQLALKLFSAKGGFLLIDEFENGLHYSVQEKVWALLFELAEKLDIQVFATTHSWDCIESFSKVASDRKDIDGVLFRMGKSMRTSDAGKIIATVFDEDALRSITQTDSEVR